tara:strand:- start:98 stop:286 length:189 start_codon:yes stop_codon:yes gene_type:complete
MKYLLKRNGKVVQHIVFVGSTKKSNNREGTVVDLEFETYEAAQEVATVLDAEIIDMNIAKVA